MSFVARGCRCDCRSALEDAANEDGHDELHDSDDDLLESSEEEEEDDDDLNHSPQRMQEPQVVKNAQPKDPTFGLSTKTSAPGVPSNNPVGGDGAANGSNRSASRPKTTGARPSVAFQMQEMEGRPSVDNGPPLGAKSDDAGEESGSLESKDDSDITEKIIREYMVSEVECPRPRQKMRHIHCFDSAQHCCFFRMPISEFIRPRRDRCIRRVLPAMVKE